MSYVERSSTIIVSSRLWRCTVSEWASRSPQVVRYLINVDDPTGILLLLDYVHDLGAIGRQCGPSASLVAPAVPRARSRRRRRHR